MEMNKVLDELEDLVISELSKIVKKADLTPVELKNATDALCLLEKIQKVTEGDDGYSEDSRGSYRRGRSMRTGRYVSMDPYRHGYSRHSIEDRLVDKLEHMMNEVDGEYEHEVIQHWIDRIKAD